MKRLIKFTLLVIILNSVIISYSQEKQSLFKGLFIGMNKKDVKKEYKTNKDSYTNIDIGNGWIYKTDLANTYVDPIKGLIRIDFFLKGTLLSGVGYENTQNALTMTRQFFENIGYSVFYENEYWNLPLNFSNSYGLIMFDKNKTKIVHLFPSKAPGSIDSYTPGLILIEYEIFMESYNKRLETIKNKQEKSGF